MTMILEKQSSSSLTLPISKRLWAIIHLCLVFSLILWYIVQPFMGEYFSLKSRLLLYEYVMGTSELLKSHSPQNEKFRRNAERFAALPKDQYLTLLNDYQVLHDYSTRSPLRKIGDATGFIITYSFL